MYTIIFHRERYNQSYNGALYVVNRKTEKEVHDYIRYMTFEQERLITEHERCNSERYHYGDYGFLVLKNGVAVYESNNFACSFDEYTCDDFDYDNEIDCCSDLAKGCNQHNIFDHLYKQLAEEEKLFAKATYEHRVQKKKQEEIDKERTLLKQLLEKYPDMKQ